MMEQNILLYGLIPGSGPYAKPWSVSELLAAIDHCVFFQVIELPDGIKAWVEHHSLSMCKEKRPTLQ